MYIKHKSYNHENTAVMYHFGRNFLFDGYLINHVDNYRKLLITCRFLFDGYLMMDKKNSVK